MAQTPKQRTAAKRQSIAKRTHERANKERAQDVIDKRTSYLAAKDSPVLLDIIKIGNDFILMHNKLAQDGVGVRKTGYKLENGQDEVENIYMTNNQRAGHLDKSAGIQELLDYIDRQLKPVSDTLAKAASGK